LAVPHRIRFFLTFSRAVAQAEVGVEHFRLQGVTAVVLILVYLPIGWI
jgi:succinate dehydrogenase hydrophobic anchor subunit